MNTGDQGTDPDTDAGTPEAAYTTGRPAEALRPLPPWQDGTGSAEHEAHADQPGAVAGGAAPTGAPAGDRVADDTSRLVGAAPGGES